MKKNILAVALFAAALSYQPAHAQMAAKKDITTSELIKHVSGLKEKNDDASKAALLKELEVMAKSNDEQLLEYTVAVYRTIAQEEKAMQVENNILKRFPKGDKARAQAFDKIFDSKLNLTGTQLEVEHEKWLKEFPEESYGKRDRMFYGAVYGNALRAIAIQFAKENNIEKINSYLTSFQNTRNYIPAVASISRELLEQGQHVAALGYLEEVYQVTQELARATFDPTNSMDRNSITASLGQALLENGQIDKAIEILTKAYALDPSEETILNLTKALTVQGKESDAILLLQEHMVQFGKKEKTLDAAKLIYPKLKNQNAGFAAFEAILDKQIRETLESNYKAEMIEREAPAFSLVNLKGKTVSLADYKDKIVVLDFWATWCIPCVKAFPAMQAAIKHYENDSDVVFLFINTWQKEENYKDLVQEFFKKNPYEFNVLFDEMKELDKATITAYGARAVPTKVFIDKEGFIRFEGPGDTMDNNVILNEIITKIELIKKG